MKYKGYYRTLFAPMIKKSISDRFGKELAEKAVRNGYVIIGLSETVYPIRSNGVVNFKYS